MAKIEIKNVYKIFGDNPSKILPMVQEGATKEQVLEETGHTVGLDNVSINVEEGETFVCMGLSGSGKSTLIRHINRLIDPTSGEVSVGFGFSIVNVTCLVGMMACLTGGTIFNLRSCNLVASEDPRLDEALSFENA